MYYEAKLSGEQLQRTRLVRLERNLERARAARFAEATALLLSLRRRTVNEFDRVVDKRDDEASYTDHTMTLGEEDARRGRGRGDRAAGRSRAGREHAVPKIRPKARVGPAPRAHAAPRRGSRLGQRAGSGSHYALPRGRGVT